MNIELWKDIEGYEGLYQVSNFGRVKSLYFDKEKILKPTKDKVGYIQINLSRNKKIKCFRVHKLVALAFISNPENLPQVNHKDENKENNKVDNLEWVSSKENINYGTRNERVSESLKEKPKSEEHKKKIGEANRKPVLQYTKDNVFVREWDSATSASTQLNIDSGSIAKCCKHKQKSAYGFVWKYKESIINLNIV